MHVYRTTSERDLCFFENFAIVRRVNIFFLDSIIIFSIVTEPIFLKLYKT